MGMISVLAHERVAVKVGLFRAFVDEIAAIFLGLDDSWLPEKPLGLKEFSREINSVSSGSEYCVAQWNYDAGANGEILTHVNDGNGWHVTALLDECPQSIANLALATNGTGYAVSWSQYWDDHYALKAQPLGQSAWAPSFQIADIPHSLVDLEAIQFGSRYAAIWSERNSAAGSSAIRVMLGY